MKPAGGSGPWLHLAEPQVLPRMNSYLSFYVKKKALERANLRITSFFSDKYHVTITPATATPSGVWQTHTSNTVVKIKEAVVTCSKHKL